MSKPIIKIWGPIGIQSYGLFVVIGIILATWLLLRDKRRNAIISEENFNKVLATIILSGIIGGRLLYVLEEPGGIKHFIDIFKIWEGGLSSFGAILSILLVAPLYLKYLQVPIIKFLDLIAIYAPLVYAMARIGCLTAGCCYGVETTLPWSIIYTNASSVAPLCKALHPTQLYSSIASLAIFFIMYFVISKKYKKTGMLICTYLMLAAIERFSVDFLRGDRSYFSTTGLLSTLSTSQYISLLIIAISLITIILIQVIGKNKKNL